jgi:serine O-acetyltransferase
MDASAEILQARKREVPEVESARQRKAYLEVFEKEDNVTVLDATRTLDEVAATAAAIILDHLSRRTARRLGIAPRVKNPEGARFLLFFCRHHLPLISRFVRIFFNSDIYCKVPDSTYLPHPYGIIIHSKATLGERVTIMQQVTIGGKDFEQNIAPRIGNDVYIGAGAKVLGGIDIGHGAVIGANAVVTRDVPANATVVGANRIVERLVTSNKNKLKAEHSSRRRWRQNEQSRPYATKQ